MMSSGSQGLTEHTLEELEQIKSDFFSGSTMFTQEERDEKLVTQV